MVVEQIGTGFIALGVLVYGALLVHGLYVVCNHVTGRKKWWKHGDEIVMSLTVLLITVGVMILVPIAYMVGSIISAIA